MSKVKKGEILNPAGRPKGSGHRQQFFQSLVMPQAANLIRQSIVMALEGNEAMLKFLLERLLPRAQDDHIEFGINAKKLGNIGSINEEIVKIIEAVSVGELTVMQGESLLNMLDKQLKNLGLIIFQTEISSLKSLLEAKGIEV